MAHLPDQSRRHACLHRLLHGPDRHLSRFYVFVVSAHDRRRVMHFNVTWTAGQIVEAFPEASAPRYGDRPELRSVLHRAADGGPMRTHLHLAAHLPVGHPGPADGEHGRGEGSRRGAEQHRDHRFYDGHGRRQVRRRPRQRLCSALEFPWERHPFARRSGANYGTRLAAVPCEEEPSS